MREDQTVIKSNFEWLPMTSRNIDISILVFALSFSPNYKSRFGMEMGIEIIPY